MTPRGTDDAERVFQEVDFPSWLDGSLESARVIAPLLLAATEPRSVVDVGCGLGAWIVAFRERGLDDVVGVDGPWVDRGQLLCPPEAFLATDLRSGLSLARRFDLALCLEVAHILEPEHADALVAGLARLADVVAFSAAIPGQGGLRHLNEQWPAYWASRFARDGLVACDPFRAALWCAPEVKWWFAQNLVCFARPDAIARLPALAASACDGAPLPLVHPGCLAEAQARGGGGQPEPAVGGRRLRLRRRRR